MSDTSQQIEQTLTLTSSSHTSLRPLIEAAIHNELRLIQTGIRQTKQRLTMFEKHYGMPTEEFLQRYRNDEIAETLDTIEWFGEWKLLESLRKDEATLQEVGFASSIK